VFFVFVVVQWLVVSAGVRVQLLEARRSSLDENFAISFLRMFATLPFDAIVTHCLTTGTDQLDHSLTNLG